MSPVTKQSQYDYRMFGNKSFEVRIQTGIWVHGSFDTVPAQLEALRTGLADSAEIQTMEKRSYTSYLSDQSDSHSSPTFSIDFLLLQSRIELGDI
jgi:hypothetical protein